MESLYRITDIKITQKNNMYGSFYDVDSLSFSDLELYIGELVRYENKKYLVTTIDHDCLEKREPCVFKGRKKI